MEHLEPFLQSLRPRLQESTLTAYRREIVRFFAAFPGIAEQSVTGEMVASYLSDRAAEAFPSTFFRAKCALRAYFSFLKKAGVRTDFPLRDTVVFPCRKAREALSAEEIEHLFSSFAPGIAGLRDRAMLCLMREADLGATEMTALCRGDVDWNEGRLYDGRSKAGRAVLLSSDALAALRAYVEVAGLQLGRSDPSDPLFLSLRGERLTRQGFWKIVRMHAALCGVDRVVSPQILQRAFRTEREKRNHKT